MQILLQPDSLSMVGSMNHFEIYSGKEVVFVLRDNTTSKIIVQHTYTPNDSSRITIKVKDIILPLLTFTLSNTSEAYEQPNILKAYDAVFTEVGATESSTVSFSVLRAGVDQLADSARNFLKNNFLTWQPNVKAVTYYMPEFLTYYALADCVMKCKAYVWNGESYDTQEVTLAYCKGKKVWTVPVQYAVVAGRLSGNALPSYYDVWMEQPNGTRLTYVQRYYASDQKSEEEQWFLFENSLGGVDTFRAYGNSENTAEHTHNVAEIEEDSEEYRVDTERKFKKNTGYLDDYERRWLLDFFPSLGKYIYSGNALRKITVTDSDVSYEAKELPSNYTFTYKYSDARPYLNLSRTGMKLKEMQIHIPDLGNFTIAPRLVEFPRQTLSDGALFPVQDPYSEEWGTTTMASIYQHVVANLADGYGGGGGIGHTHHNMDLLNALSDYRGYILYKGEKLKAGFADEADDFTEDGKASKKILRKDIEDTAQKIIHFLEGLDVGDGTHGIDADGDAILKDVVVDRIHDPKSTPAERVLIGAQGFDLYVGTDGKAHMYIDYLAVRNKAFFSALELRKVSYSGGTILLSNAGSTIVKVVYIFDESGEKVIAYKCYAKADDGTTATNNWWRVGMMALCQTFNIKPGIYNNVSNRYYWRLCIGAGQETLSDGKLYDFVILSNVEKFGGGDAVLPSYGLRILADESGNYLSWGSVLVGINARENNTSLAQLYEQQYGDNKDEAGTLITDRQFYGYEPVEGGEPDAPSAGDVIVNAGDQIKWDSYGNVIKMTTSTEENGTKNAPAIWMYQGIGAPRTTEANVINVWQWKHVIGVYSPLKTRVNSDYFKFYTGDDPYDEFDPWADVLDKAKGYTSSELEITNKRITAITSKINFKQDENGNWIVDNINKSGLITTDNMSTQFSALIDTKGKILALAQLSTAIVTPEELNKDDYKDENTYEILKNLCKPISEVRISGDMIDIDAKHVLNITGPYLTITSTNFTLNGTGNLTTNSAVLNSATINHADINKAKLNDVVIRGSLVSPWQQTGTYLDIGTGKVSYPVANNISAGGEGGWGDGDVDKIFNWDSNDSGRLIRLAAFDKTGRDQVGFKLTSKNGCYFYENGMAHSSIVGNNEILELIGYGDSSKFYGYIVVSRKYINTPYSYGPNFNPIAYGRVSAGYNYGPHITYATCNLSTMTVSRLSEGRYKLFFSGLKLLKKEHTMIMVTGYMDTGHLSANVGDTPLKASVDEIGDGYAIISVSDDNSRNEGSFFFMI